MKRKKQKGMLAPSSTTTCKNCPTTLIEPKNSHFRHYQRHGLCSACCANEIDALNEKLSRGGIVNEDVEAQNKLMVHALFFYGDKRNYGILGGTRIRVDKGQQARDALASGLSQEALRNVRDCTTLYKALDEIQDLAERHHHGEGGWSNMDMCEIWTITEALLAARKKKGMLDITC
jgi:hypothetical protein